MYADDLFDVLGVPMPVIGFRVVPFAAFGLVFSGPMGSVAVNTVLGVLGFFNLEPAAIEFDHGLGGPDVAFLVKGAIDEEQVPGLEWWL